MYQKKSLVTIVAFALSLSGTFGYADDASLASLQRDVVLAKQKNEELLGKLNSARIVLDRAQIDTQTSPAGNQNSAVIPKDGLAGSSVEISQPPSGRIDKKLELPPPQSFKDRFEEVPPRRVVTAVPGVDEDSPLKAFDVTPSPGESLIDSTKKKIRWPDFGSLFRDKSKIKSPEPGSRHEKMYEPTPLKDGEAMYKVAISDNKISVEEAVEIGLANDLKLQAAKKNVEVADAKLTEAKRALFPTLQGVMEINGGKIPGVSGSRFYKGRNQKLNVTQPLYYGGELANTVKQAEENIRAAKAEYKKAKDDLVHEIRIAFYGVVKAEYNTEYQIELFEKVGEVLKMVKSQKEAKVIAEIDYLNVESQYYQILYQLEASKNDVLSANVSLKQAINLELEGTIPVDLKMDFVKVYPKLEELLGRAYDMNADVQVKAFALESARYGIDIYESKKKPHIELRGSYGKLGEAFHDTIAFEDNKASIDQEKEWFLGVQGSMPLGPNSIEYEQVKHVYGPTVLSLTGSEDWKHSIRFNLFDKFGAITDEKQAQYALLQAESEYKTVKEEIALKLRDDYYSLQRYLIQIDSSIAKLRYTNKQISILEYLLSVQETTPSNLVDNLISQTQDRYAFIQAIADYNVVLSSVGLLIGDPFYFENQREMSPQKYEAAQISEAKAR